MGNQAAAHLKAQLSGDEERSDPKTWSTKVFRGHVRMDWTRTRKKPGLILQYIWDYTTK